jgi:GNAT superfamily N-acetyltransferase
MEPLSLVDPQARSGGIGRRLLEAAKDEALALGSSSVMLSASPHNAAARQLFERSGVRPTMIEMRIERDRPPTLPCTPLDSV